MGRPVVASALGQTATLLGPDGAGLLVPPGDAAALTEALTWIARDPHLAADLAQRAARLGQRLDWTANADRVTAIVQQRAAA